MFLADLSSTAPNGSRDTMENDKNDIDAYLAKIRKTISESESLVSQAELRIAETDRFLASQGLTREQVMQFKIDDADRATVNEELKRLGLPPLEADELNGSQDTSPSPAFSLPDTQGDLENRRRRFGTMMKTFRI